jgi:hypothetical protein
MHYNPPLPRTVVNNSLLELNNAKRNLRLNALVRFSSYRSNSSISYGPDNLFSIVIVGPCLAHTSTFEPYICYPHYPNTLTILYIF